LAENVDSINIDPLGHSGAAGVWVRTFQDGHQH